MSSIGLLRKKDKRAAAQADSGCAHTNTRTLSQGADGVWYPKQAEDPGGLLD